MDFSRTTIRTLSMLGQRGAFGYALTELAKDNDRIIALTADLCTTSGLDRFKNDYPDRVINVGIAEQNMIGIAAGLSTLNYIPFATTFSNFAALRSNEQIRHFLGYMKENVKVVGFGAGFAMGMFGTTHYGIEDLATLRSIPNITIVSPADGLETAKATAAIQNHNGPVYFRLSGVMNQPIIYQKDYDFEIGKAIRLRDGNQIGIMATGGMVYQALKVADLFESQGISTRVVNFHTIKPIDQVEIFDSLNLRLIVSIEEHSVIGGLGSSITEVISSVQATPPHLMIGVTNEYKIAGSYEFMLDQYGLTINSILKKISEKYNEVIKDEQQ